MDGDQHQFSTRHGPLNSGQIILPCFIRLQYILPRSFWVSNIYFYEIHSCLNWFIFEWCFLSVLLPFKTVLCNALEIGFLINSDHQVCSSFQVTHGLAATSSVNFTVFLPTIFNVTLRLEQSFMAHPLVSYNSFTYFCFTCLTDAYNLDVLALLTNTPAQT